MSLWTDEQCFELNAHQHRGDMHPYTCGNDSRHRPLIATRQGWRCADCDYTQNWAHNMPAPPAEKEFPIYTETQRGVFYAPAVMSANELILVREQLLCALDVIERLLPPPEKASDA